MPMPSPLLPIPLPAAPPLGSKVQIPVLVAALPSGPTVAVSQAWTTHWPVTVVRLLRLLNTVEVQVVLCTGVGAAGGLVYQNLDETVGREGRKEERKKEKKGVVMVCAIIVILTG
jgi:hypothetical protein